MVLLVSPLPQKHKGLPAPPTSLHTTFPLGERITSKQLDFYHGFQLGTPSTFVVGKPVYLSVGSNCFRLIDTQFISK